MEPLVTVVSADLSVSIASAALLTSAYALPFALGQPLLGPFGDIYGKSLVLKISVSVLACALLLAAIAPTFELLALARFCAGFAAGGVVPACMATIGDAYPPERRQVAISTFVTMGLLAQVFATSASALVGAALGWRYVLWGTAVIGIIGAAAGVSALPRSAGKREQRFSVGLVWSNYRLVFRNPKAILCYTTVFLEGVALYGIMPYVGVILGQHDLGGAREAGFIIGAIGVGGLLYVSFVSVLLRRWKRRQFMAAGGLLMMFGPLGLAFLDHWPTIAAAFAVNRRWIHASAQFYPDGSGGPRAQRASICLLAARLFILYRAGVRATALRLQSHASWCALSFDAERRCPRHHGSGHGSSVWSTRRAAN
jgi:predicted MFS family arabinose efflux permease